jgi:hypothetical protein
MYLESLLAEVMCRMDHPLSYYNKFPDIQYLSIQNSHPPDKNFKENLTFIYIYIYTYKKNL